MSSGGKIASCVGSYGIKSSALNNAALHPCIKNKLYGVTTREFENIYLAYFDENMHSNGLWDPGGKAVADSLSTWHSELFYRGGPSPRPGPNSPKAYHG